MNKTKFLRSCPKTRAEFVAKFNSDYVFRGNAENFGIKVVCGNVILPNGKVATAKIK